MTVTVSYRPYYDWVTIMVTPYITWQGHFKDVPNKYKQYLYIGFGL